MTYDRGAERLFDAVVATCDPKADFAARVEAGLRSDCFTQDRPVLAQIAEVIAARSARLRKTLSEPIES